jgi:hypothetical protein
MLARLSIVCAVGTGVLLACAPAQTSVDGNAVDAIVIASEAPRQPWLGAMSDHPSDCFLNVHWRNSQNTPRVLEMVKTLSADWKALEVVGGIDPVSLDAALTVPRRADFSCDMERLPALFRGVPEIEISPAAGLRPEQWNELRNAEGGCTIRLATGRSPDRTERTLQALMRRGIGGVFSWTVEGGEPEATLHVYRNCELGEQELKRRFEEIIETEF